MKPKLVEMLLIFLGPWIIGFMIVMVVQMIKVILKILHPY